MSNTRLTDELMDTSITSDSSQQTDSSPSSLSCLRDTEELTDDSVVREVMSKFNSRSVVGVKKYGVTLDRDDLTRTEWLTHLQEELMDATLYIQKLLRVIKTL